MDLKHLEMAADVFDPNATQARREVMQEEAAYQKGLRRGRIEAIIAVLSVLVVLGILIHTA